MDNKRLNINDIPEKLKSVMRDRFESDPRIRLQRLKAQDLCNRGNFSEALLINKQIEDMYYQILLGYISDAEKNIEQIELNFAKIPSDDIEYVLTNIMTVFIVADIMDLAIFNANARLWKTDKDLSLDMFEDLNQTAKLAQHKMSYLCKTTNYIENGGWDNIVDNLYDMMYNKAKSIMRNARKHDINNILKPKNNG